MSSPSLSPHICRPAWEAGASSPKASLRVQYTFHTPSWCGCGIPSLDIRIEFWTEVHPISSGTCHRALSRREKQRNRKEGKQFRRPMRQRPMKRRTRHRGTPRPGPRGQTPPLTEAPRRSRRRRSRRRRSQRRRSRRRSPRSRRSRGPQSCTRNARVRPAGGWLRSSENSFPGHLGF